MAVMAKLRYNRGVMLARRRVILCCACASLLTAACNRVEVRVNSFLSNDLDFPDPGVSAIRVIAETSPPNDLFEAQVAATIKRHLRALGQRPAADDEPADYALVCWFGADDGATHTGTEAIHGPPRVRTTYYRTSRGRWLASHSYTTGAVHYVPYSYTIFQRAVDLHLYKAPDSTTTAPADEAGSLVWQATAASPGHSRDLRGAIPYLLAAAFEYWGLDSGSEQRTTYRRKDDRVIR